jgi:hypothetical protein
VERDAVAFAVHEDGHEAVLGEICRLGIVTFPPAFSTRSSTIVRSGSAERYTTARASADGL